MKEIELIIKKLKNELSPEEKASFDLWLNDKPENKVFFNQLRMLFGKGKDIEKLTQLDVEKAWTMVLQKNKQKNTYKVQKLRKLTISLRYAAGIAILIGLSVLLYTQLKPVEENQLIITKDDITLQLADGRIEVIRPVEIKKVIDQHGKAVVEQKGMALHYKSLDLPDTLVYNELNVPYGHQFTLFLSDGSRVELNSGTRFKYPVNFISGLDRKVFLNGEAYFEVAKDSEHPFVVTSTTMDVQVLGTSFNLNAYEDELETSAVLVEGSIKISRKGHPVNKEIILEPGHMALLTATGALNVSKVEVSKYIAWMEDAVVFIDVNFTDVIKRLERKYSVQIINHYDKLDMEKYTGRFDSESILQILESFRYDIPFNYEIDGNKINIYKSDKNGME